MAGKRDSKEDKLTQTIEVDVAYGPHCIDCVNSLEAALRPRGCIVQSMRCSSKN